MSYGVMYSSNKCFSLPLNAIANMLKRVFLRSVTSLLDIVVALAPPSLRKREKDEEEHQSERRGKIAVPTP